MQQYIGIDVGGTHVKYGVINSDGEELTHHQFDTPEDASTFTRKWQDVVGVASRTMTLRQSGSVSPAILIPITVMRQKRARWHTWMTST